MIVAQSEIKNVTTLSSFFASAKNNPIIDKDESRTKNEFNNNALVIIIVDRVITEIFKIF